MSDCPRPGAAPRVAIYFRMFGPYILARIGAAANRMPVIGLEGSQRSTVYAWDRRDATDGFDRRILVRDGAIEDQSPVRMIAAARAALDAADPAIVCIPGWSYSEALTMLSWARERGRGVVVMSESTAHDATRSWWREWIKRRVVRLCDAALVGGQPQRAYIESLGMPPSRVFVGYDAVDNAFFAAGAAAARADAVTVRAALGLPARYFLGSGRFIAKKNLAGLIDAYAAYRTAAGETGWDLVLLGDGELRAELEAQVSALGIADAVHFMGFRQYDDLPKFYGLAGGFVHVSTVEQWGLVVNEAMAAGLPVIVSTPCGCAVDLVEADGNGWLVDPSDGSAITAALTALASPTTDLAAMGARGVAMIDAFGPARFADGLAAAVHAIGTGPVKQAGPLSRTFLRLLAARNTRDGG